MKVITTIYTEGGELTGEHDLADILEQGIKDPSSDPIRVMAEIMDHLVERGVMSLEKAQYIAAPPKYELKRSTGVAWSDGVNE